jgi:hypothetical protein
MQETVSIDTGAARLIVAPGDQLAIVLSAADNLPQWTIWTIAGPNKSNIYPRGEPYFSLFGGPWQLLENGLDLRFRSWLSDLP